MQQTRITAKETINKVGEEVVLKGWIDSFRKHGNVVFVDLRDRTGLIQVVFSGDLLEQAGELRPEYVIEVHGEVNKRGERYFNPKLETGEVEVQAKKLVVLNKAETPPFPLDTDGHEIDEDTRLKYRYLDLRRKRMTANIRKRGEVTQFIRNWLYKNEFVEIETPVLTKTTPEGARDFLVPSRKQAGKFYALPQSPQQYKQMLMVAGFERYFQIARCFRDEDPRADRAYGEFTQVDMEMSFVTQDDILQLTETMFTQLVETLFPEKHIKQKPWPRIPYKEAMEKYGSDKPDLRENKDDWDELAFAWVIDFPLFAEQSDDDYFYGSGKAKYAPSHHMFTAPNPEDLAMLDTDPLKVRGLQHDMVLNGSEVGGGSIRIHDAKIQEKIFDLIGFTEQQKAQFTHLLEAFTYGVPPHGGIAPGLDRFLYRILGETSLREVMAFPAQASGQTAVMDAPSEATKEQLEELHIKTVNPAD